MDFFSAGGTGDKVVVATCKKAKAKREKTDGFSPKQEGGKIKVNPLAVKRSRVFTASSFSFSDAEEGGREGAARQNKNLQCAAAVTSFSPFSPPTAGNDWALNKKKLRNFESEISAGHTHGRAATAIASEKALAIYFLLLFRRPFSPLHVSLRS